MPPELEAAVAESLLAPVARSRTALQAEVVVSHMIGTVREGVEGGPEGVEDAVRLLLRGLVAPLEGAASADALAVLRVLRSTRRTKLASRRLRQPTARLESGCRTVRGRTGSAARSFCGPGGTGTCSGSRRRSRCSSPTVGATMP